MEISEISDRKFPSTKRISRRIYISFCDVTQLENVKIIYGATKIKSVCNSQNLKFYVCADILLNINRAMVKSTPLSSRK